MHSLHHGPDRNGTVLEETGYENTYAAATALARKARREYGKCQAVCESTGNLWIKTYEAFEDRGIPIELANPMKVRAIAEASVKTDKVDARTLAHLLRTNLIARCHVAERGLLASEIDGIGRFASPRKLVSWAGMCPTVHQSGNTMYHGRMMKDSNRKVNWVLIQAAHVAVLYDGRIRDYYERMKKTHHSSIAITHVANKMIKIIWHMLTNRALYEDRNEKLSEKA